MKEINVFWGPKQAFESKIPNEYKTLAEFINEDDAKRKKYTHHISKDDTPPPIEYLETEYIESLVAYSESYAGITEAAVQGFLNIISNYEIDYIYLQNPPMPILKQFEQAFPNKMNIEPYEYKTLTAEMFWQLNANFSDTIIGQEHVKEKALASLFPLMRRRNKHPIVLMFYGPSGVGKTETAKFISEVIGQKIFRKQFSMFHSYEFSTYLFGGTHSQSSFAQDLLDRESNVILLDEFDKSADLFHSAFYQLFDEGIFEDKNYRVLMKDAIIICTSNYQNENEIRKALGDPIFFRFNKFIKFEPLSHDAKVHIIEKVVSDKHNELNEDDRHLVDKDYITALLVSNCKRIDNVRQIANLVDEYIDITLVQNFLTKQINEG